MSVSAVQTSVSPLPGAEKPVPPSLSVRGKAADLRRSTGEFVGDIFYGTLLREMQKSSFKTKYFNGGRGEEAFQGQLSQELAKRIGRTRNDAVAQRLFESIGKRLGVTSDTPSEGTTTTSSVQKGGLE